MTTSGFKNSKLTASFEAKTSCTGFHNTKLMSFKARLDGIEGVVITLESSSVKGHDKKDGTLWDTSHSKGAPLHFDTLHTNLHWDHPLFCPPQRGTAPSTPSSRQMRSPAASPADHRCCPAHLFLKQLHQKWNCDCYLTATK